MSILFESRFAAGVELRATIALQRDSLLLAMSDGAIEVAHALACRSSCELRRLGGSATLAHRDVWLVDDGLADEGAVMSAARWIGALRPRQLHLVSPVLSRTLAHGLHVDGIHKIYWAEVVPPDVELYGRRPADVSYLLRSAAAARAWSERLTERIGSPARG